MWKRYCQEFLFVLHAVGSLKPSLRLCWPSLHNFNTLLTCHNMLTSSHDSPFPLWIVIQSMIPSAYCYSWTGAFSRSNDCILIISSGHYFTAVTVPLILLAMTNHWRCYEITVIVCDTTCRIRLEPSWSDPVSDMLVGSIWSKYIGFFQNFVYVYIGLVGSNIAELAFQVKSHFIHPSLCKGYNVLL